MPHLAPWQQTLLTWLGYDFSDSAGGRPELIWTNRPDSWGVFVLIAVVAGMLYAVFSIYRRELDTCPRWVKILLACLRAGVVLLLACIFLGPALVYLQNRTIQPTIVVASRCVAVDEHARCLYRPGRGQDRGRHAWARPSMQSAAGKPSRTQIVNEVLSSPREMLLRELASAARSRSSTSPTRSTKVDVRQPKPAADGKAKSADAKEPGEAEPSAGDAERCRRWWPRAADRISGWRFARR